MQLYPTFYFRPLGSPIILSHHFNIILRNPTIEELPLFKHNIQTLCNQLSDNERRKILYTLYPLGNFQTQGTIQEQFITELSKIWIIAVSDRKTPFEKDLIDYGYLCGFLSDGTYLRNPGGFICDITNLSPREILRALKKELPKAAKQILNPSITIEDLTELEQQTSLWDGILSQNKLTTHCIQLAKSLRSAHNMKDPIQKFLQYCITAEILLVHNPSTGDSKMPMNKQFTNKLTLIRHMMIKLKNQKSIHTLEIVNSLFNQIYELRSQIIHGRQVQKPSKREIANYINLIYPTIRLALELQTSDPTFINFIYKI